MVYRWCNGGVTGGVTGVAGDLSVLAARQEVAEAKAAREEVKVSKNGKEGQEVAAEEGGELTKQTAKNFMDFLVERWNAGSYGNLLSNTQARGANIEIATPISCNGHVTVV